MKLAGVDLNLLTAMEALFQEKQITRAAKRIGLTQPAMSRALNRLRATFDDQLFVTNKKGLILTPRAQEIQKRLPSILDEVRKIVEKPTKFDPKKDPKTFKIAASDYSTSILIPRIFNFLTTNEFKVKIEFISLQSLRSSNPKTQIDLVISKKIPTIEKMPHEILWVENFVACIHRDFKTNDSSLTLGEFVSYPHILWTPMGLGVSEVDQWLLDNTDLKREIQLKVDNFFLALDTLKYKKSFMVCPKKAIGQWGEKFQINQLDLPFQLTDYEIAMAWPKSLETDTANQWLRKTIQLLAKEINK